MVEVVCVRDPLVPVIVSERAVGVALVVVFIVRVAEPLPRIEDGLNPPLDIPVGNPFSLPTLRLTVPVKPPRAWTVTVKVADWPGVTEFDEGVIVTEKSGVEGSAWIVRVGGLGSELPLLSIAVRELT